MPRPTFEPEPHRYTLGGHPVPSVTQVLHACAMLPDYSRLDPYYRVRGSAVHRAIALDLLGRLDQHSVDEHTRPYLERARRLIDTLGIVPRVVEHRWALETSAGAYAGTLDLFCDSELGPLLLDWKAGQWESAHAVQVAGGYLPLLEDAAREAAVPVEPEEVRGCRVAVVTLNKELPSPTWVERDGQVEIFRAALAVARWRRAKKVRRYAA